MKTLSVILVLALMSTMIGCMEQMTTEQKSAVTGAVVGGAIGDMIGSKRADAGKGILIGAAIGGAGGYLLGKIQAGQEGEAAIVDCPHCKSTNIVPEQAKAGDIIECHSCGKQFQLQ